MKRSERLVGFVKYNDVEFPFEFNEETFNLMLYPPTSDVWRDYSGFKTLIKRINDRKGETNWIEDSEIRGITSESSIIVFNVLDTPSNYHGFLSLEVNWYIICSNGLTPENIYGFAISGNDIDRYYSPQIALKASLEVEQDSAKMMTVSSVQVLPESCGVYNVQGSISAKTEVYAYASFKPRIWTSPISASSEIITSFSEPSGIEVLLRAYGNLRRFFKIINYQSEIYFENIELFRITNDGKRSYTGHLCFREHPVHLRQNRVDEKIITHNLVGLNLSRFLEDKKELSAGLLHLINSTTRKNSYSSSRIIMVLIAFEQIFTSIYGKDSGRSEAYLEVKDEIIKILDDYLSYQKGRRKGYAKSIKDYVNKRDSSFEEALKKSFCNNEDVMRPFVLRKYEGDYLVVTESISARMGELRNEIAHGRLDFDYQPIHVSDIHIIENIIYTMLLKEYEVDSEDAKKAINQLFDVKIVISD